MAENNKTQEQATAEAVDLNTMVIPLEDAWVIIEIMSEINEISEKGILPDGDSVNEPTRLRAEYAIRRFNEKYKSVRLIKKG